jgi:hypothetical protein
VPETNCIFERKLGNRCNQEPSLAVWMQKVDTHRAQHDKVRESEELGGYTDEAQADAAAKAADYFEFR